MIKIVKECKNPQILVVTPLLPDHGISKNTKISINRNKTPFYWITSSGDNNIPTNSLNGIKWFKNRFGSLPSFYIMIDRDIDAGRGMLDKLYERLKDTPSNIGYCYATFQFKGHINHDFPAMPFNINRLLQANYISSNSMFKSNVIEDVGLVTDEKYKRLLDWAFLIKCFDNGYIGIPEPRAYFVANSTKDDISARSSEDYKIKYRRVFEDFIVPILKKTLDK
jgi:hypothetical protein